ncbi:MAG: M23 family metallopeptidase [Anaerolineae bacterium]|nr:M23 family metallopeptidase [Anaerolineae bacterium]
MLRRFTGIRYTQVLVAGLWLSALLAMPAAPVMAGGGIVLRPPFDGICRLTTYFDHYTPIYSSDPDGDVTIYTGETTDNCEPYCYRGHPGIDWGMPTGTNVLAAAAGVVERARAVDDGYGCRVVLGHSNGYKTLYAHMDGWWNQNTNSWVCTGFAVNEGDLVQTGTVLGSSGNTGASTGPHLHFTVEHNDFPTDPFGWRGAGQDPLVNYSGETAACLWGGAPGAAISCADILVEDDGAGWSQSGYWGETPAGNGYRQHWTNVWAQVSAYARWTPPTYAYYPGYYQLYAFIPADNSTTTNADYEIYIYPSTTHRYVNQNNPPNTNFWAALGSHRLQGDSEWVYLDDYTGEAQNSRRIAADTLKFTAGIVYLPDLRIWGGATSTIIIHNPQAGAAQVQINYYNSSGRVAYATATLPGYGRTALLPPANFVGSAVAVANQDIAVVVQTMQGSELTLYNGIEAGGGALGWEQAGVTLYAPIVKNNYYGRSATLEVLNAGHAAAQVSVRYYRHDTGSFLGSATATLAPHVRSSFTSAAYCAAGNSYYCTAVISNDNGQPLAAVVRESGAGDSSPTVHDVFAAAGVANYVPLVKNSYYGQTTGLGIHNPGAAAAAATLTYYDSQSAATYTFQYTIAPHATWTSYAPAGLPANFVGSAVVNAPQPLVTVLYEAGAGYNKATNAFLGGGPLLSAPLVNTTSGYASGLSVQNVGGGAATFTVAYYDGNGALQGTRGPYALAAGDTQILYTGNSGIPANFNGSARIVATNGVPLAATVNYVIPGTGDTHATYSAGQP